MKIKNKEMKNIYKLILFCAGLILGIIYARDLWGILLKFFGILVPFIIGGAMAFIFNIPMRRIEKLLFSGTKNRIVLKLKRPISLVLAVLFVLVLISFVAFLILPQLATTIVDLGKKIPEFVNSTIAWLETTSSDNPQIMEILEDIKNVQIDWNSITSNAIKLVTDGFGSVMNITFSVASSVINIVVNIFLSIVFSIYLLTQKEKFSAQCKKVLYAFLSQERAGKVLRVFSMLHRNFSNFIAGQCVEAVILGSLFVITMSIFRLPYALLIGVLIAFMSLIPIVGTFIACFLGAFLILIVSPIQAIEFVIIFLILQQIEGNLIYPHVVGSSVGLPSIWRFISVIIGGSLFGILGMLTFIPLVSTAYELFREIIDKKTEQKIGKRAEQMNVEQIVPKQNEIK
jgi:predicted PurR-regulated permease PerM